MDDQLSMGEITISKQKGKRKSTLIPVARLTLDSEKQLEVEARQNPSDLRNIKAWQ